MRHLALALAASTALVAPSAFAQTVQTAAPAAPDQEPAFENQTRAPQPPADAEVSTETVGDGLPNLWSLEFLPDGRMLVSAKQGDLYLLGPDGELGDPIPGVPEVDARGQGGLLDVALGPDFAETGTIYFSYAEPREEGGNGTSVARGRLETGDAGTPELRDVEVIFRQTPAYDGDKHFGSRLVFAPDETLYVTVGERSDARIRDRAQDLSAGMGKIFRITPEGAPADGNPFLDQSDAQPEIWSYGHRNLQSAALDGEGRLWTVEHGPKGGDELNRPEAGLNYGWPVITYGVEYSGQPVGEGRTEAEGMEQPVYYWDPVIGPSGMAFYDGDEIPEWQGAFLVGGLVSQGVVVLHMEDDRVEYEERLSLGARIRDVKVGPDGAVYAVTETRGGGGSTIVRISGQAG
ncbi:PQQ-dependent sugar dehydrogenase [Lutibaculum baratangense]|nr:PQQ-dependent sugar dehydrogenase [Lutibaculum baratangense]